MGKKKKPNNPQPGTDGKPEPGVAATVAPQPTVAVPAPPQPTRPSNEPCNDGQTGSKKNKKKQKSSDAGPAQEKRDTDNKGHQQQKQNIVTPEPHPSQQSTSTQNLKFQQQSSGSQPQPSSSGQNPPSAWGQSQKPAWGPQPSIPSSSMDKQPVGHVEMPPPQLPPDAQQSVPMGKKNRNKYPKGGKATQQQAVQQPMTTQGAQALPEVAPLSQQMQEKLVFQPSQSISPTSSSGASTPSKSLNGTARKSRGGYSPLEVVPGSCVGRTGATLTIEANYLRIKLDRLVPKAYHYDIRFDPEKMPKKHLQDIVEMFRVKHFKNDFIAFDGQNNVYSANPLPFKGIVLKDEILWHDSQTNRDRNITLTLKQVDTFEIDLTAIKKYVDKSPGITKPLRAIQCLEIVLRMPFSKMFVNVNRSFFTRPARQIDLGENYELWTGLYQSVVLGEVALFNIDVVNKPFPSSRTVLNILTEVMRLDVTQPIRYTDELHNYLKGLTLVYNQPGTSFSNVFKYNGLKDSATNQTFMCENRKMTVAAYFKEKNIQLRYPHLPCLWCGPSIKNIYLPLEFCSVQDGQVVKKKLSENQIRQVIAETATSTDTRKKRIMDLLQKIRHNDSKVVQKFGINIGDKFTEVEARILPTPRLEYLSNPEVKVDRGVWNAEREKFLDGKHCTNWSVLKLDERCQNSDIFKLATMISDIGGKANMSFARQFTDLIEMRANSRKHEIEEKMAGLKRKNVELLFVIIPNRSEAYPNVKQAAELRCGILTQCIKSFTLSRKLNGSTVYNILLKLNSKLNGLNHKVFVRDIPPIGRGKIMIVGADVTHPTGTMNEPSAVGVASSHDINALKYNMCWRIQNPTQEMITDLKNIMVEQLNYYKKCMNNELPDTILYYRDGVSDGQFEEVLSTELAAIFNACQQMAPNYRPKVTFIVVQKRHNTRFYPGASKVFCGKNNNVMPGTIVDKFIIDPRQYQFFLVSHAAIQGVAKPTKYCVIWDDSNIKADELQALTYNLCHVFTRCNRAVSYVAPTYYAHLAAYRGKVYVQNERLNMTNLDHEFRQRQIREEISKGHPMFFV